MFQLHNAGRDALRELCVYLHLPNYPQKDELAEQISTLGAVICQLQTLWRKFDVIHLQNVVPFFSAEVDMLVTTHPNLETQFPATPSSAEYAGTKHVCVST